MYKGGVLKSGTYYVFFLSPAWMTCCHCWRRNTASTSAIYLRITCSPPLLHCLFPPPKICPHRVSNGRKCLGWTSWLTFTKNPSKKPLDTATSRSSLTPELSIVPLSTDCWTQRKAAPGLTGILLACTTQGRLLVMYFLNHMCATRDYFCYWLIYLLFSQFIDESFGY